MSTHMPDSHNLDKIIGTRVRIASTSKNLEQKELAKIINISQSYLSRIESGDRSLSAQLFCAICISLEIEEAKLNPYKNAPILAPLILPM